MRKLVIVSLLLLSACSSFGGRPQAPVINYSDSDKLYIVKYKETAAQAGVPVKIGTPYEIRDEWYFPVHEPSYNRTGRASWYGPGFHGKRTANGEAFNQYAMTAAHPSLPMPSIVEVTNLDNGRSVRVRVNDRGPFHSDRIIDVSKAAAEALDMIRSGTANVRVRLLPNETLEYLKYARR